MLSFLISLNASGKLWGVVVAVVASVALTQLPGPVRMDTQLAFFENAQWEVRQVIEIAPNVNQAINSGDESVAQLIDQIAKLKGAAAGTDVNFVYSEQTRSDGWRVITAAGNGVGFDKLNTLIFNDKADISVGLFGQGQREVSFFATNLEPEQVTAAGGEITYRITAQQINQSNADQIQLGNTAIWQDPVEISFKIIEFSGAPPSVLLTAPAPGGDQPQAQPAQAPGDVNVIRNGDFELPWQQQDGVAPEWEGYDNGFAHFGWYEELWPEAVWNGERAQLMEIFEVEPNNLDRVMAIHQTVDVAANAEYHLELFAIMRSDADLELRNQNELEMHWGIDPFGEGNYENVTKWIRMPLNEQNRLGSHAPFPEDIPLEYQQITGTVTTSDTNRITLFIRGLKKFPTNVEVNFDIDDVSLVGPPPGTVISAIEPVPAQDQPAEEDATLPTSGGLVARPVPVGLIALGGLVLVIIGAGAVTSLLYSHRKGL
jgi:hypothetical protein